MNRYGTVLFAGVAALTLLARAFHELMVFRVNRHLPPNQRIPHFPFNSFGWSKLGEAYRELYPRSILYHLMLQCYVAILILALAMVALRSWEYVSGR